MPRPMLHQVEADLFSEASILAVVRGGDAKADRSTGRRDDSEPQQGALLKSHVASYLTAPKRLTGTAPRLGRLSAVGERWGIIKCVTSVATCKTAPI